MISRLRLLFLFGILFCVSGIASAQLQKIDENDQDQQDQDVKDLKWTQRIVVGGNLGAQFGDFTAVDISPLAGYRVTKNWIVGAGFTYQFVSYKDPYHIYPSYKVHIIGGRVFTQYDIFLGLFAHLEYEDLWVKVIPDEPNAPYSAQIPGIFVGAGYNFPLAKSAYFQIMGLYNLLWKSDNLVYGGPFQLRMGVMLGI